MNSTFWYAFGMSLSLILAIGAQNAFVLKQGIKKQYVFIVCLICAFSDAILISLGVFGFGAVIEQHPILVTVAKYFGSLFLIIYGLKSFYSAIKNNESLTPEGEDKSSMMEVIVVCLAFTWLNPHVYLDTMLLLGSIATQYPDKFSFALGATASSWVFFFSLGYGATLLRPWFANPKAWKVLDVLVGMLMLLIAFKLLTN